MGKTDPQSKKPVQTPRLIIMERALITGVRRTGVGLGERRYKSVRLVITGLEVSVDLDLEDNYWNCPREITNDD